MSCPRGVAAIFIVYFGILFSSLNAYAMACTSLIPYNGANGDSSSIIQACIDDEPSGGVVELPAGIYMINALDSIKLKNNINLHLEKGTILKAIPNNSTVYAVVKIWNVQNVSIEGGSLEGERDRHIISNSGRLGEWGMGIDIRESSMVKISNLTVRNAWGDGIYIGRANGTDNNKNIIIENVICDNNRRQGISLITGENVLIENATLENTHGTAPQFGIDMQPDDTNLDTLKNIILRNVATINNAGGGIVIYNPPDNYFISITNHTSKGEAYPLNNLLGYKKDSKGILIYGEKEFGYNCNSGCFVPSCDMDGLCDAGENGTNCPTDCANIWKPPLVDNNKEVNISWFEMACDGVNRFIDSLKRAILSGHS